LSFGTNLLLLFVVVVGFWSSALLVPVVEKVRHCQLSVHVEKCSWTFECFPQFFNLATTQLYSVPQLAPFLLSFYFLNDFWLGVNVQSGIMVNGIGKLFQHLHQMDIKKLTSLTDCNDALTLQISYYEKP